ncbi:MAG: hypothetical protein JJ859_12890 [Roseicyclus sp.]|nr:hypothetical protein [Roseicyclus sp.]
MTNMSVCPGCLGRFADIEGPVHAYLKGSAECWARFGQALALQYSDHRYWPAHQLLTDAYSLQHSLGDDLRARRSARIHLAALYAQIHLGQSEARLVALRKALSDPSLADLPTVWPVPSVSIAEIDISEPARHLHSVERFARAVLSDWSDHHSIAAQLCKV